MARMKGFLKRVPDVDIALAKLSAALGVGDAARRGPSRFRKHQGRQRSDEKMPPRVHGAFPSSKLFMVRILPYNLRNPRSSNRDRERRPSHCWAEGTTRASDRIRARHDDLHRVRATTGAADSPDHSLRLGSGL